MNSPRGIRAPNTGAIAGQVTTTRGEPIVDAVVMITSSSPDHKDIAALTSEQGKYRFDDLIPGNYTVLANTEHGVQTRQAHVDVGQTTCLDFSLPG